MVDPPTALVSLRVHFSQEPSLQQFMALEDHLSAALRRPVHLRPVLE
jgi:predicted nucleotidyltransferase